VPLVAGETLIQQLQRDFEPRPLRTACDIILQFIQVGHILIGCIKSHNFGNIDHK